MSVADGRVTGVPAELRQARIAAHVAEQGFVRVRELSERFGVSSVTLRNDLDVLERRGDVQRVHGGAMSRRGLHELTFEEAETALGDEKAAIGRRAAALVQHGEAIALDVGTTAMAFARALVDRTELTDVTVFTNGLNIALELEPATPRIAVVVCGGTLRPKQHSLVNPLASAFFDQVRVATAFLGCNGMDLEAGVTNSNLPEAEVKRAMVKAARRRVVLADRTKLGEVALAPVCSADEVDVLVTDDGATGPILAELRHRGVEVLHAGEVVMTMSDLRVPAAVVPTLDRHDLVHPDGRSFSVYGPLHGSLDGQPADHDVSALHLRFDRATAAWVAISPARNTRPGGSRERRRTGRPRARCARGVWSSRSRTRVRCSTTASRPSRRSPGPLRAAARRLPRAVPGRRLHLGPRGFAVHVAAGRRGASGSHVAGPHRRPVGRGPCVRDGVREPRRRHRATLTHPHGQLYAFGFTPPAVQQKLAALQAHRLAEGTCLGCVVTEEDDRSSRVIAANDTFVVAVPFAPRWPYEVHIRARRHGLGRLSDCTPQEALDLAKAIRDVVTRFDALFGFELPYMLCVQEAPVGATDWHLHVEFLPPHRDERRLKVRASVETALGVFINDTLPERSAERLAGVSVATTSWEGVAVPVVRPVHGRTTTSTTTSPAQGAGHATHEGDHHA